MRIRTANHAGIQPDREQLRRIYARQFRETAQLRRHVLSLLPLHHAQTVFEPGCGSGLLGRQLKTLTNASYTGMDIDGEILPKEEGFRQGDAVKNPLSADISISSFFFSSVKDPVRWLKRVRANHFAVVAEYDYQAVTEEPDMGIIPKLMDSLDLHTSHGGRLDEYFRKAGFRKLHGGTLTGSPCEPDRDFLHMHLKDLPEKLPLMVWPVVWGIWKKNRR